MKVAAGERFAKEVAHVDLKLCCEDCAYFSARTDACSHGWPTAPHRLVALQLAPETVTFCKEFELR